MAGKKKHASDYKDIPKTQHPAFIVPPQAPPLFAYPPDAIASYEYTQGTM